MVFDQDDMTLKYDFHLAVIKWSDVSLYYQRVYNTSHSQARSVCLGMRLFNLVKEILLIIIIYKLQHNMSADIYALITERF